MSIPRKPAVDRWYKDAEDGRSFRIVAIDEDEGTIEVQFFDGDVDEFDMDSWYLMDLTPVAEPEDGSGPFDDLESDDLGETYQAIRPEDWNGPADEMDYEE